MRSRFEGRSPQGECGLKYYGEAAHLSDHASLPARGVWIEIGSVDDEDSVYSSLPARGVWIEITCSNRLSRAACRSPQGECGLKCQRLLDASRVVGSLPARGVWIEIDMLAVNDSGGVVAPRKGSVD